MPALEWAAQALWEVALGAALLSAHLRARPRCGPAPSLLARQQWGTAPPLLAVLRLVVQALGLVAAVRLVLSTYRL